MGRPPVNNHCGGQKGVPHRPEIRMGVLGAKRMGLDFEPCRSWRRLSGDGYYLTEWSCGHEEVCSRCGLILRFSLLPGECPQYDAKGTR